MECDRTQRRIKDGTDCPSLEDGWMMINPGSRIVYWG